MPRNGYGIFLQTMGRRKAEVQGEGVGRPHVRRDARSLPAPSRASEGAFARRLKSQLLALGAVFVENVFHDVRRSGFWGSKEEVVQHGVSRIAHDHGLRNVAEPS